MCYGFIIVSSCGRMVIAVVCKTIRFSIVGSIPTNCNLRGSQIGKALVFDISIMGSSPIL